MTRLEKLKESYKKLYELDTHEKMLYLVSALTEYFDGRDIQPIIVGGLSVELYTRSNYTTYDIDVITPGREEIGKLLTEELHFEAVGRSWYNKDLELSIEIPSNHLEGDINKVMEVNLPDNGKVYVIGLEDIIIHRLESAMLNHSRTPEWSEDYEWAKRMFAIHRDDQDLINKDYLKSASEDKRVVSIIKDWLKEK